MVREQRDLAPRAAAQLRRGRLGTPAPVVLRMLVLIAPLEYMRCRYGFIVDPPCHAAVGLVEKNPRVEDALNATRAGGPRSLGRVGNEVQTTV